MKAIAHDRFGPPDTLHLADTEKLEICSGEILLEVRTAAVNPYDWHMARDQLRIARLVGRVRLTKPKTRIAGVDVAGRVQAVGADVHGQRPVDEAFGLGPIDLMLSRAVDRGEIDHAKLTPGVRRVASIWSCTS